MLRSWRHLGSLWDERPSPANCDSQQEPLPPATSDNILAGAKLDLVADLPPDYDSDPERWRSWEAPHDVHQMTASELRGPVLDVGCGDGRLPALLDGFVTWVGLDSSPAQLRAKPLSTRRIGRHARPALSR